MSNDHKIQSQRGGALVLVIIFASALSLVLASVVKVAMGESRFNQRYLIKSQSDYANQSALELGALQVKQRIATQGVPVAGSSFNISLRDEDYKNFLDSDVLGYVVSGDSEVKIGTFPVRQQRYIDPNNPQYEDDELLGMVVNSYEIPIYAKTTLSKGNVEISSYGKTVMEIREAPLFSYALFFNMELPTFAGGDLVANGRVHANGDLTISSNHSYARQVFYDTVTVTGDIKDDPFFGNNNRGETMFLSGVDESGDPIFTSNMDKQVVYTDPGGRTYTSEKFNSGVDQFGNPITFESLQNSGNSNNHFYTTDENAYDLVLENWNGFVKSGVHGVSKRTPPGMDEYNFHRKSTHESFVNTAYQIIQPVRNLNDPSLSAPGAADADYVSKYENYEKNWSREKGKFAYRSGLIIEVKGSTVSKSEPKRTFETLDPATVDFEFYTYQRDADGSIVYDGSGEPVKIDLGTPSGLVEVDAYQESSADSSVLDSGMRDNRRKRTLDLIKLDVGRLKELVDGHSSASGTTFNADGNGADLTSGWWNGGVYVKFPYDPTNRRTGTSGPAADGVQPAIDGYGLYIHNGQSLPSKGLTIATNNVVYLAGHYNSDGVIDSDSISAPEANEVPAAIAADAVTLLSANWEPNENWKRSTDGTSPFQRPAVDTEYSTAIISGQVPRGKDTETGGQVNCTVANFLRLHENWGSGSKHYYVRGSVVALYESEIAHQRLPGHADIYVFPGRNYGYNVLFDYAQPPLAPYTTVMKMLRYRSLTSDEYAAETSGL